MKKIILTPFLSIIFLIPALTFAQQVGIGEWRDLLPYQNTTTVEEVGTRLYCSTPYSLFYYDTEDMSIQRISKVNGLSDIGVSHISFNAQEDVLVVAYSNTNLDLVENGEYINIPDIKRKEILGNKTINKVVNREKFAYLACGFGIVVIDLDRKEVKDTYFIGPEGAPVFVYDIAFDDDFIYATTDEGIYFAENDDPNLAFFGNWEKMDGLPFADGPYNLVAVYNGSLIINYPDDDTQEDILMIDSESGWFEFDEEPNGQTASVRVGPENTLLVSYFYSVKEYDSGLNRILTIYTYGESGPQPNDAILGSDGEFYWIADRVRGLVKVWGGGFEREFITPSGAPVSDIYAMSTGGGNLWLVPGGMSGTWGNIWKSADIYSFIDERWQTYNRYQYEGLDTLRDMVTIKVDPFNPSRVFAGSWWRGALEFNDGELTRMYTMENSSLEKHELEGAPVVKVGGIDFDNDRNAWFSNSGGEDILSVRRDDGTPEGEWQSYNLGSATIGIYAREVLADSYGNKWIICRVTSSSPANPYYVYVFNENNPVGQRVRGLRSGTGEGALPGNSVYSFAEDRDGEVWLGTDDGIAIFYSPENVLLADADAQRPLVDFDGYVQYLLESETVKAIAVDGANQKWIGTERAGVFLLSEDGSEQIYHFTEENSPLLSNTITSMAINGETGEVYIGTAKGLIGYKSMATEPKPENSDVYAYPNPVRPGYQGPIAVKGLVDNATVKFTDVNGNLVYETVAEGGQAIWNGYDFSGRRARSGVFLVFISNPDGSETMVTKVLFVN